MPSLIAATLASEKPTDGYLVNDIISILGSESTGFNFTLTVIKEMSFESQQVRLFLQEYLMNQLVTSRNVFVKTKVWSWHSCLYTYLTCEHIHMHICTHYIHTHMHILCTHTCRVYILTHVHVLYVFCNVYRC